MSDQEREALNECLKALAFMCLCSMSGECGHDDPIVRAAMDKAHAALAPREPSGCTPCADCGGDYAAECGWWRVEDDLWQLVVGSDPTIVLCPSCFTRRALAACESAVLPSYPDDPQDREDAAREEPILSQFAAAADEIIRLNDGTPLSASDVLALRGWFDERRKARGDGAGPGCERCNWTGVAPDGENECEACYVEHDDTERSDAQKPLALEIIRNLVVGDHAEEEYGAWVAEGEDFLRRHAIPDTTTTTRDTGRERDQ